MSLRRSVDEELQRLRHVLKADATRRTQLVQRADEAEARAHALGHLVAALVRKFGDGRPVTLTPVEMEGPHALRITPVDGDDGQALVLTLEEQEEAP